MAWEGGMSKEDFFEALRVIVIIIVVFGLVGDRRQLVSS